MGNDDDSKGLRPVPDPTLLTTQQLLRENLWLREVIETRLNGMDKAIELLQATADKFPARMDEKIASLKDVHEEKFRTVDVRFDNVNGQFEERDVRVKESATAASTAINAALAGQEKAAAEQAKSFQVSIDKAERATVERFNQQQAFQEKSAEGLNAKIEDVKDRVTRREGMGGGLAQGWQWLLGAMTIAVALYLALKH